MSIITSLVRHSPLGTIMTMSKMMMPTIRQILIFMSFHHICFLTLLAPRLNPCAETARLSVLSCRLSRRSPRSETLLILLRMTLTVESISCHQSSAISSSNETVARLQAVMKKYVRGVSIHVLDKAVDWIARHPPYWLFPSMRGSRPPLRLGMNIQSFT